MIDWAEVRERFPAVAERVYLDTAAGAPVSRGAARAGASYYETTLRDGDVHWDEWLERVENVRSAAAGLVGGAADDIAFVGNATAGIDLAAGMLADAGEVLLVGDDFPSVTWPWMQRGFPVRFVEPEGHGGADLAALEAARTPETGVLALSLVHYRTGYRHDLAELASWCRDREIALVVDATQGLGAVPVDVAGGDVDFLVSSAYKWLTAGYGVGLLYVSPRQRSSERYSRVGWRSAREPYALDAGRLDVAESAHVLEGGHPPFPGVFSLGAALELFGQIGSEVVWERVCSLMQRLAAGLAELGLEPEAPVDPDRGSGILSISVAEPAAAVRRLADRDVLVSARGGSLRVSAHLYNDESDADRFLAALGESCGR